MKIRNKILLLLLVPFLFLSVFQFDIINSFISKNQQIREEVIRPFTEETEYTTNLNFELLEKNEIIHEMSIQKWNKSNDEFEQLLIEYLEVKEDMNNDMSKLRNLSMDYYNRSSDFAKIEDTFKEINEKEKEFFADLENEESDINFLLLNELHAGQDLLASQLKEYNQKSFNNFIAASQQLKDLETDSSKALIISSELMLIAFVGLTLIIHMIIVKPIEYIKETMEEISEGKLDTEVAEKDRNDEIGELARAFERTIVSLKLAMKKTPPKPRIKPINEEF